MVVAARMVPMCTIVETNLKSGPLTGFANLVFGKALPFDFVFDESAKGSMRARALVEDCFNKVYWSWRLRLGLLGLLFGFVRWLFNGS